MSAAYTLVLLESDSKGRLQIAVSDESGAGHGYRIAGPKYDGVEVDVAFRHELDSRDVDEIRLYLRLFDEIHDGDMPPEVHALTKALDWHRSQLRTVRRYGELPHQQERLGKTRAALAAACTALLAALAVTA